MIDSTSVFTDGWFQETASPGTPIESVIVFSFGWFEGDGGVVVIRIPRPPVFIGNPFIM